MCNEFSAVSRYDPETQRPGLPYSINEANDDEEICNFKDVVVLSKNKFEELSE